jgi:arsenate reductase
MAEGFLKSFDSELEVYSAGTHPAAHANPYAVAVMKEAGIDISGNKPKSVDQYLAEPFDYVITVCDDARESCPYFSGKVLHRIHMGFEDPAKARGTEEEILGVYRKIRDQIREEFSKFHKTL